MTSAQIWQKALNAAQSASQNCNPTPMVVGTPTSLFSNEIDHSKQVYEVSDGVCGFAWVKITPARGKFVKFLKESKIGYTGHYGGYVIWMGIAVCGNTQSMERKIAAAVAMAEVFHSNGIKCYVESRMD